MFCCLPYKSAKCVLGQTLTSHHQTINKMLRTNATVSFEFAVAAKLARAALRMNVFPCYCVPDSNRKYALVNDLRGPMTP